MVEIINLGLEAGSPSFYYPPKTMHGLEAFVKFPGSEFKGGGIPNSTVWVFNAANHCYNPDILGNDVGCGMACFLMPHVNNEEAAEAIFSYLNGKNILGRGNHFVDICGMIDSIVFKDPRPCYSMMIIHTDGKSYDSSIPTTVQDAKRKQESAEEFRRELGHNLACLLGGNESMLRNWTHNSVEECEGKVVYRKGAVKIVPGDMYILPAHLNSKILFYCINKNAMLAYNSMPHGTGRACPRGDSAVGEEQASEVRKMVYVPRGIPNTSLKSEHPSCFNDMGQITDLFSKEIIPIGTARILSYIGKI